MKKFQKALRLQKKADRHMWRNCYRPSTVEPYWGYTSEGMDLRIKKSMRKGTGPLAVAC